MSSTVKHDSNPRPRSTPSGDGLACRNGVPGELVADLGSMLKWCSPFRRIGAMNQSAGVHSYITHTNACGWEDYEAFAGTLRPSFVRPLTRAIPTAAEELHG